MPIADDFEILPNKTIHFSGTLASGVSTEALYSYLVEEWGYIRRFLFIDGAWHRVDAFGNKVDNEMA